MDLKLQPDNSVCWERDLQGISFEITAEDIRRDRTGLHARIKIIYRVLLAVDTFNTGRQEDRTRLAKSAFLHLKTGLEAEYPLEYIKHDLDLFCDELPAVWEQDRFQIALYDADEKAPPIEYVVKPYAMEGAGTVFFAAPGSGKSYILMAIGASIAAGISLLFDVPRRRPVLYLNLERSASSMKRRFYYVAQCLGIRSIEHQLFFLTARGQPFRSLSKRIIKWQAAHPDGVGIIDSISRSGEGSMVKDDVANEIVDWMNGHFRTWLAIGHTSRADAEHVFGSVHFDAGEDVGVKVVSESKENGDLGVMLEIVKANDIRKPPPQYLCLSFEGENLTAIKRAMVSDFPKLIVAHAQTDAQKLMHYLLEVGCATGTDAAMATGVNRSNAANILSSASQFQVHHKEGIKVFYCVKAQEDLPF